MTKKSLKRKRQVGEENEPPKEKIELPPAKRMSDEPTPKKPRWINRQRVLAFSTRGISFQHRHLMDDIKKLLPHHRAESKMERTKNLQVINEMCEMKNCNKTVLFEGRRKRDLYMWFSNVPAGPSAKFLVENIYTMGELKMTGNCLKGTRPLLSFDENFGTKPHYSLLKELLTQIFGVPNHHPKSQPFFDHVYTFSVLDNRIWFRNYQILTEDGGLAEIGPRFVLNPVKIFAGSFGGETIWDNSTYISPAKFRQAFKKRAAGKYENRIDQKMAQKANKPEVIWALNPTQEIFKGDLMSKAAEIEVEDAAVVEKKVTPKAKKVKQKFNLKKLSEKSVNKKKLGKPLKKKKKVVKKVKSQGN